MNVERADHVNKNVTTLWGHIDANAVLALYPTEDGASVSWCTLGSGDYFLFKNNFPFKYPSTTFEYNNCVLSYLLLFPLFSIVCLLSAFCSKFDTL